MPRPEATSLSSRAWSYASPFTDSSHRHHGTTRLIHLAHEPRDLPTELLPHVDVEPVVNAGVNPREPGFGHHRVQAVGLRGEERAQRLDGRRRTERRRRAWPELIGRP